MTLKPIIEGVRSFKTQGLGEKAEGNRRNAFSRFCRWPTWPTLPMKASYQPYRVKIRHRSAPKA